MIVKMFCFTDEGEITHYAEGNDEFAQNTYTQIVASYPNPRTEYWDGTQVIPRPTCPVTIDKTTCSADGFDTIHLSNCVGKFFLDGIEYPITDPDIYLTFDDSGSHQVRVRNFPMQDFEAIINAN